MARFHTGESTSKGLAARRCHTGGWGVWSGARSTGQTCRSSRCTSEGDCFPPPNWYKRIQSCNTDLEIGSGSSPGHHDLGTNGHNCFEAKHDDCRIRSLLGHSLANSRTHQDCRNLVRLSKTQRLLTVLAPRRCKNGKPAHGRASSSQSQVLIRQRHRSSTSSSCSSCHHRQGLR